MIATQIDFTFESPERDNCRVWSVTFSKGTPYQTYWNVVVSYQELTEKPTVVLDGTIGKYSTVDQPCIPIAMAWLGKAYARVRIERPGFS